MRRLLSALVVIVVAVSLLAQTYSPPGKAGLPEASCVVSGHVVAAADGSPLKSAKVTLVPEMGTPLFAATTDSDGRFSLKDVKPGRYNFAASRSGFVTQYYKTNGTDDGAILSLKAGEQVGNVLFRMVVSGVITGRLTDEDGEPMVRAQVVALVEPNQEALEDEGALPFWKSKLQPVASALTDDRGQYRIFGLSPGEYYLKAADSSDPDTNGLTNQASWIREELGSEYAPAYYPGVAQAGQAQVIPVKASEEVQADFFMRRSKAAKISGLVIGTSGPAGSAWIRLGYAGEYDSGGERQTRTDEKGRFEIKGVPPGTYLISVLQKSDGRDIYETRGQQKVEVNGEDIDSVIISVGGGTNFQGRVTFDGAGPTKPRRMGVLLYHADDEQAWESDMNKDGTFEIKSVSDGTYGVRVWGLESNWYVKSARLGGEDLLDTGLRVEKGASGGKIEVVVNSASAQLEGSVSSGDTAVAGAHVRVVPEPETPYNRFRAHSIRTDQTGHFSFIGLAPGKYRVIARYGSAAEGDALKSEPQIVTLSERDHKTIQIAVVKAQ